MKFRLYQNDHGATVLEHIPTKSGIEFRCSITTMMGKMLKFVLEHRRQYDPPAGYVLRQLLPGRARETAAIRREEVEYFDTMMRRYGSAEQALAILLADYPMHPEYFEELRLQHAEQMLLKVCQPGIEKATP